MITQGELNIKNLFGIFQIDEFELEIKPNQHATARIVGETRDLTAYNDWKHTDSDKLVEICDGNNIIIFTGYVNDVSCSYESQIHYITVDIISTSEALDRHKKSKSFQNVSMTYTDIVDYCISDEHAGCTYMVNDKTPIGVPLIRYRETTWEFVKRMASHFNTVIYPEEVSGKGSIVFGFKTQDNLIEITSDNYSHGIAEKYWDVKGKADIYAGDFEYYRVNTHENIQIGQNVIFDNKSLYVIEKKGSLKKGVLEFEYLLAGKRFITVPKSYRAGFAGLTILGKVIETGGETVKLHLDIDKTQTKDTAFPYKWTPDTGSVMYCMPEIGTTVSLYFSDEDETSATATSCIRENGDICPAMSDTDLKNFSNPSGKKLYMYPETAGMQSPGSGQTIDIKDDNGIDLEGPLKISLYALEEISFEGKTVTIDAPNGIQLVKG